MNEDSSARDSSKPNDPKAKFLEALEKKKSKGGATPGTSGGSGTKIGKANKVQMRRRCSVGNLVEVNPRFRTKD